MILSIQEFVGHLHPLLVHLPIGILLLAGLFQFLSRKEKFASLQPAVSITLFLGMLSAVASCISGYILSGSEDYDEQLVSTHQWFGISVAAISLVALFLHNRKNVLTKWVILLMILLIIITGHLGGSLTHGSDYLTKPFSNNEEKIIENKPIPDVQEAVVYSDIIQPLFQSKCYTCHGANKKKGKLRLDQPEFILKGGKDGKVIKPDSADESDMIKRLMLPRNHEDHMPPKEKPQLKDNEIALIHWWIATGASFEKKTKELEQPEKLKQALLALQKVVKKIPSDVPATPVAIANEDAVQKLKQRGVVIVPVALNSNYLLANFVTANPITDKDLELLIPVEKQLIWLKLSNKKITDEGMKYISRLKNLTRLYIDYSMITDKGLVSLTSLNNLQYLNLVGTAITSKGMLQLKGLTNLQSVYLYKTNITGTDWTNLKNTFPKTMIDSGGYIVPLLESDTTEVKPPKEIKN